MSETTTECARGCTRKNRHLSECEGDGCKGCEPRRAEHGRLCWPCHRRLELMLTQAEITERWLTGNLGSGIKAAHAKDDADRIRSHKEPPAPLAVAILDARQNLRDRLACWVDDLCEDQNLTGPGRHTVEGDAKYLLTWLTTIERFEWIGDWFEELAETMGDAHVVAPWRPEFNRLRAIPCPECHESALGIFGGESDVTCTSCRAIYTPERYGIWTRVLLHEKEREQREREQEAAG